jgi:serine/threonine protein kinase
VSGHATTDSSPVRLLRHAALASGSSRLSPELEADTARRLGALALVSSVVATVMHLIDVTYRPDAVLGIPLRTALSALSVVAALALHFAISRRRLSSSLALDLGIAYELLHGLVLGILFHAPSSPVDVQGWSPVAVWILIYPLVVPSPPRRVALASAATALMDPMGLAINVLAGAPAPHLTAVLQQLVPMLMACVIAPIASGICYGLTLEVKRARDMGAYRLVERLGRGGMGEVWRAEHRMLARPAAIKLIRTAAADAENPSYALEMAKRFEREAKATAMLRSPHTIVVYDYGVAEDGVFHYVMELLEGYSLQALVGRFGPICPERTVHLLIQACRSLEEAHAAGLVHRDIKPANLFTCRLGLEVDFLKVLDFGLVKIPWGGLRGAEDITRQGTFIGTPAFMPPEVALGGEPIDGRADLYALGCVAYWLLTGQRVFENANPMQTVIEHVRTRPVPVSERASQPIPEALERIVMRCLEKDPAARPASAGELARELTELGIAAAWTGDRALNWWLHHAPAPTVSSDDSTATMASRSAAYDDSSRHPFAPLVA